MEQQNEQQEEFVKQPSETMIYISNLPFSTTDEQLAGLFEGFEVKTAYIAVRKNGRSKGFGFVNLADPADQAKAIEQVSGKSVEGRTISAKIALNDTRRNERGELKEEFKNQQTRRPRRNRQEDNEPEAEPSKTAIYVSNLPQSANNETLNQIFAEFAIKSVSVGTRNGICKGFGFVEFENVEDQQKALSYNEKEVDGNKIEVAVANNYLGPNKRRRRRKRVQQDSSNQRSFAPRRAQKPRSSQTTLYVANLPYDIEDVDLAQIFEEFHAKDAYIATRRGGRSKGFGFVEFENHSDQQNALDALDKSEVNGREISVKVAEDRTAEELNNPNRSRPRRVRPARSEREKSETMIYVSNLPFSLDDEKFSALFSDFSVEKAYVATRGNGRSKGFGFVNFNSNEDQSKALEKVDGMELEGRKIGAQVAFKRVEQPEEASAPAVENSTPAAKEEN